MSYNPSCHRFSWNWIQFSSQVSLCVFPAENSTIFGNLPLDLPAESPRGTPPTQGYLTSNSGDLYHSITCTVSGVAVSTWSLRGMSSGQQEAGIPGTSVDSLVGDKLRGPGWECADEALD